MNECCEHLRKCRYAVGCNMPGYMPDSDVAHYGNYRDALGAFRDDCKRAIDDLMDMAANDGHTQEEELDEEEKQLRADLKAACRSPRKRIERQVYIGQYVYWISAI